ncbi:MAG: DUF4190 domain-containing protein [Candidatus Diapherotrites archaeon]|nr:DUF4190 domain-containing protein [Candidatus Diapherotrites archaeon]
MDSEVVPETQRKTSLLAIVALIFAILVPPLGLVLGIIAYNKIKRDPSLKGEDIALLAIVIGAVLTVVLIVIGAITIILSGAWLGLWKIPEADSAAPAKMLIIGQPSQKTIAVLNNLTDLVLYVTRSADSLQISPKEQLAQYDIVMLDQSNSAGPFISKALGDALHDYVAKGGKLIIVKNSGTLSKDAPGAAGWLANLGDIAPVECTLDKHNIPTCLQPIRIRGELIKLDFDHPIMEGIERVPALPSEPLLDLEVFDVAVKGKEIAYIKDADSTKKYPGIVERKYILGKVIYFNYNPGKTPEIFINTLNYLK